MREQAQKFALLVPEGVVDRERAQSKFGTLFCRRVIKSVCAEVLLPRRSGSGLTGQWLYPPICTISRNSAPVIGMTEKRDRRTSWMFFKLRILFDLAQRDRLAQGFDWRKIDGAPIAFPSRLCRDKRAA